MPSLCFDWQGEWLLLFNYLIPFSEQLDQSGQALDCEGGGARVNIKTEQVRGIVMNWSSINRKPQKTCAKPKSAVQMLVSLMYLFVFLRSVNFSCLSVKTSARTTTESMCWGWGCIYCIYSIFRSPFFPPTSPVVFLFSSSLTHLLFLVFPGAVASSLQPDVLSSLSVKSIERALPQRSGHP